MGMVTIDKRNLQSNVWSFDVAMYAAAHRYQSHFEKQYTLWYMSTIDKKKRALEQQC